jgi:hypothetical protein
MNILDRMINRFKYKPKAMIDIKVKMLTYKDNNGKVTTSWICPVCGKEHLLTKDKVQYCRSETIQQVSRCQARITICPFWFTINKEGKFKSVKSRQCTACSAVLPDTDDIDNIDIVCPNCGFHN